MQSSAVEAKDYSDSHLTGSMPLALKFKPEGLTAAESKSVSHSVESSQSASSEVVRLEPNSAIK